MDDDESAPLIGRSSSTDATRRLLPKDLAALHTMRLPAWTPLLEQVSGYSADDLSGCVAELHNVFRKAESNSLQAVREKYSHAKFLCVSTLTPPDTAP